MRTLDCLLATALVLACSPPRSVEVAGLEAEPEQVSFPASDGGTVHADLYGSGERALVLAHGGRFTKESWAAQVPVFVERGFRVLAIDFRGRGDSVAGPDADPDDVHLDVLAAIRLLRSHGAGGVSVVGASFGGWAAARAAILTQPGEIDALVLLAAPAIEDPGRIPGRKLFLTARDDARGGEIPRLPEIRDQFERAPEPKQLVVVDGSAHAQYLFESEQGPEVLRTIVGFLGSTD